MKKWLCCLVIVVKDKLMIRQRISHQAGVHIISKK